MNSSVARKALIEHLCDLDEAGQESFTMTDVAELGPDLTWGRSRQWFYRELEDLVQEGCLIRPSLKTYPARWLFASPEPVSRAPSRVTFTPSGRCEYPC